jgi:predicted alpha/beta-hydrolase family hydrolase
VPHSFTIPVDDVRNVSARLYAATGPERRGATLVLAHGAGAGQLSPFMTSFARALSARGLDIVTFNFLYMEARRRVPDPTAVLEGTWRRAIAAAADLEACTGNRLVIGGKSMGGRIASQVAAEPEALPARVDALVFLGYPLHPPGQPDRRRDAHLTRIDAPMLFVQGERDAFGTAAELRPLVDALPRASLYVVAQANHSLETPKRDAPPKDEVFAAVQDHIARWIGESC